MQIDNDILICIFNYRHDENARRWYKLLSPYFDVYVLDSGNDKKCDDFIQYPNIYYTGLWNEMKKLSEKHEYKFVGCICSDVEIDDRNAQNFIGRLKWLKTTINVGIWQPGCDTRRSKWLGIYNGKDTQSLYFLEGWIHIINSKILKSQRYVNTEENMCGTNIDVVTSYISIQNEFINIMDDNVLVHHPLETGYSDVKVGEATGRNYLLKEGTRDGNEKLYTDFRKRCENNNINDNNNIKYRELELVSFTSYKKRFPTLIQMVDSILSGTIKPDKIVFVVDFDDVDYIPSDIKEYIDAGIIETIITKEGLRPHQKYYNSYKKYGNEYNIITVDDDRIYSKTFLEDLIYYHENHPNCVIGRRGHKITLCDGGNNINSYFKWEYEYSNETDEESYLLFPTGVGGVLYPKNSFEKYPPNIEEIRKIITADDIYLKYLSNLNQIKSYIIPCLPFKQDNGVRGCDNTEMLALTNNINKKNDEYLEEFDLIKTIPQKYCVYTCITGNYDTLIEVKKETGWDYICFTDMDISSNTWEIRRIPEELKDLSNVKKQRMIKVLPYKYLPEYEETIWIDANISIKPTIQEYYDLCKSYNKPIVFKKHPIRNCIYAEMDACLKYKKDTKENIEKLRTRYEQENMPHNDGMYETNIIYRYNYDVYANALMKMWGEEILSNSHRDQLSLNYCIWKLHSYDYIYSMDNKTCEKYFTLSGHKRNNYSIYVHKTKEIANSFSHESNPVISIDTSNQGNKTLILIEKSQYNPIIHGLYRRFSRSFDTQIIDCPNRNYVNCYKKLFEYEKLYDWILLIKSNVSFEWASSKYIDTIIDTIKDVTNRKKLGLFGFNASKSSSLLSGLLNTNITQDQFVLINTKLLEKCEDIKFPDNYGFGFISYLNNLSKKCGLDTLVDLRVPIKTYSNIEGYETPAVSKMVREFLKNNPL